MNVSSDISMIMDWMGAGVEKQETSFLLSFHTSKRGKLQIYQGLSPFLTSAALTSDIQVDKDLLVALSRAGVALVPALVLDFEPPQEQGGVAVRDLGVEQGRPSAEVFVLQSKLVLVVVVAMDRDLLLVPVDHHGAGGPEAARQDAVFADDTGDVGI